MIRPTITQLKIGLILVTFGVLLLSGVTLYRSYQQYTQKNAHQTACARAGREISPSPTGSPANQTICDGSVLPGSVK